jgi:hypothetical protein
VPLLIPTYDETSPRYMARWAVFVEQSQWPVAPRVGKNSASWPRRKSSGGASSRSGFCGASKHCRGTSRHVARWRTQVEDLATIT